MLTKRSVYGLLLFAYPREFRQEFGAEMIEVFAELARDSHGVRGAIFLWRLVLWELIGIAVPLRLQDTRVIAGASSFIISSALMLAFFRFAS
jgi:hypothetical protein